MKTTARIVISEECNLKLSTECLNPSEDIYVLKEIK